MSQGLWSKSGLEPTGDCDMTTCHHSSSDDISSPNQDSSRQAIVTGSVDAFMGRDYLQSKSGLEPTGDCDVEDVEGEVVFKITASKSGLEPTGDCDAPTVERRLLPVRPVQIRTRADRRL